jgi:hypothetical protein
MLFGHMKGGALLLVLAVDGLAVLEQRAGASDGPGDRADVKRRTVAPCVADALRQPGRVLGDPRTGLGAPA